MLQQNKTIKIILTLIFIMAQYAVAQGIRETRRSSNYLREGPGVYYKLTDILPSGEKVNVLEDNGKWSRVRTVKGDIGWISNKSFMERKQKINI